jgi:hypothetical protein
VELKTGFNDDGPASISWVTFSKTGRMVYYRDRALLRIIRGGIGSTVVTFSPATSIGFRE